MSQSPPLEEVIESAITERLDHVYTAMPARIESYDPKLQRVSVQPMVMGARVGESGERVAERLPVVQDVPVVFPGAGTWSITFPLDAGVTGLLVFANCSLDQWLASGSEIDPISDRRHSIADAVFIPGLRPFAAPVGAGTPPSTTAMVLAGADVRIGGNDAEAAIRGQTWSTAFDDLVDAIKDVFSAIQNPGTYTGAVSTAFNTAVTAFFNAAWLATNAKVK